MTCLCKRHNPRDVVRLDAANEEFDIDADHERLSPARQQDSPHIRIGRRLRERLLKLVNDSRVQFVELVRSVYGNRGDSIGHRKLDKG